MGNLHSTQQRLRHLQNDSIYENPVSSNNKMNNQGISASFPPNPKSSLNTNILYQQMNKDHYDKSTESYIINGRKYQNYNKKYILPFDEIEQDRLTQLHFLYKHLFGSNFSAPVKDLLKITSSKRSSGSSQNQWVYDIPPPRVLDIACGNGTWVLEMATEFPNSQFFGVDIVASYPTAVKPANTFFSQCDILNSNGLPFPNEYFDYIHIRQAYTCFSENDWKIIVSEIKRLLKPGGYVEFREVDPMMKRIGPVITKFFENFPRIMKEKLDVNVLWASQMYDTLSDIGDMSELHRIIKQSRFNVPGPIGNLVQTSLRSALDSYKLFFQKYNNIPVLSYEKAVDDVVNEAIQYDSYFNYYCCWGRKSLLSDNECLHQDEQSPPVVNRHPSLLDNASSLKRNRSLSGSSRERLESNNEDVFHYVIENNNQKPHLSSSSLEEQIVFLATESVNDIDQFVEGYED